MISIRDVIEKLVSDTKDFDKPCQVRIVVRNSYGSLDYVIDLPTEVTVTCDECGEEVTVELSEYAGEPPTVGVDPSSLEEIGGGGLTTGEVNFARSVPNRIKRDLSPDLAPVA